MSAHSAPDTALLSSNWKRLQQSLKSQQQQVGRPGRQSGQQARRTVNAAGPPRKKVKTKHSASHPVSNGATKVAARMVNKGSSSVVKASKSKSKPGPGKPDDGATQTKREPLLTSASLALWAEDNDIPRKDLIAAYGSTSLLSSKKKKQVNSTHSLPTAPPPLTYTDTINEGLSPRVVSEAGRYLAIDCEMVGVGPAPHRESALARVSVVNFHGQQIYDSFVLPQEKVTDYRTHVSGITPALLQRARPFATVQTDIANLLAGKVLIGHAVRHDLDALMLGHPRRMIRDTSRHGAYRKLVAGGGGVAGRRRTPGLKKLAREVLGIDIQSGEHSSIEDARATMLLFRREKEAFERDHVSKFGLDRPSTGGATSDKKRIRDEHLQLPKGQTRSDTPRKRKVKR